MESEQSPYARFSERERILRDELAIDRTVLANERTFLAYLRTAFAFWVVGGYCLKSFASITVAAIGTIFVAGGVLLLAEGIRRTRRMHKHIRVVRGTSEADSGNP